MLSHRLVELRQTELIEQRKRVELSDVLIMLKSYVSIPVVYPDTGDVVSYIAVPLANVFYSRAWDKIFQILGTKDSGDLVAVDQLSLIGL